MNNLLKTIKENNERFEHLQPNYNDIKSHIRQSRISELEALVEMIESKKLDYLEDDHDYNQALTDIINEIEKIIKELKV